MLKVYVAGSVRERMERAVPAIVQLRAAGVEITFDWTTDLDTNANEASSDAEVPDDVRLRAASDDMDGVQRADYVLFLAPDERGASGAWTEFGIALASKVPIVVVGQKGRRNIFTSKAHQAFERDADGIAFLVGVQTAGTAKVCDNNPEVTQESWTSKDGVNWKRYRGNHGCSCTWIENPARITPAESLEPCDLHMTWARNFGPLSPELMAALAQDDDGPATRTQEAKAAKEDPFGYIEPQDRDASTAFFRSLEQDNIGVDGATVSRIAPRLVGAMAMHRLQGAGDATPAPRTDNVQSVIDDLDKRRITLRNAAAEAVKRVHDLRGDARRTNYNMYFDIAEKLRRVLEDEDRRPGPTTAQRLDYPRTKDSGDK